MISRRCYGNAVREKRPELWEFFLKGYHEVSPVERPKAWNYLEGVAARLRKRAEAASISKFFSPKSL